ncbi:MAG: hypothetical protein KDK91_26075, partial [Gammaproteobacteria bacterium]|nr:hypothetical protein [Gammaproteobacteria bacterium]
MRRLKSIFRDATVLAVLGLVATRALAASAALLGWNNLGMHCMDSSYSEFSILPPYNTIEAQLIVGGKLVTAPSGFSVTYEAVADPNGSINTTSTGKGNWYANAFDLYGAVLTDADQGLAGCDMPGTGNHPQPMRFEADNVPAPGVSTPVSWFHAEGIPLTPYDDAGLKNTYPLMRLVARDMLGHIIAQSDIVLPVSDEMDCKACHAPGSHPDAEPAAGWITDANVEREYRLNVLAVHDDREFAAHTALYAESLSANGLNAAGLYASARAGTPVLCAACHASEALGKPSFQSTAGHGAVPSLTQSMHAFHAEVTDTSGMKLDDSRNRSACYQCHPGSSTRCLRGAMGSAVAADGSLAMQCQSCHG